MLSHLSIQNFAVIKELDLDLHPGLNIITGETGAGKSVIIQAVSMALGSRADTDFIRSGEDKAVVTLTVEEDPALPEKLAGIGAPEDIPVVLKREISAQSRSLCRINGSIVPLSQLSSICKGIADI
ncbi:MAG: AAA family ATPase, partial [Firmicutes bacterium]|nr:AAA family ATPase [Bacillota bacterium]